MCVITPVAITPLDCGRRKVHVSLPGGSGAGDADSCTVPLSAATSAIGIATGVAAEPMIRSTLSSVTKRLAFFTPLVGSLASSGMMRLSFCPATVVGHSLNWFCIGRPRPEAGPVSGRLTPTVRSARAVPAISDAASTARRERRGFIARLSPFVLMNERSAAQGLDVVGHGNGTQAVRIVGIALDEGTHLAALADEFVAAHHLVHL